MQDNTLTLKKNDDGQTVQVVTTTETQEVPLSSDELKRQIDEHQAIVDRLQAQYDAVKAFEESAETETTVTLGADA